MSSRSLNCLAAPKEPEPTASGPSFGEWDGGDGPIVALERAFGGDGFSTMAYDNSLYEEKGLHGNGGNLALSTVALIFSGGALVTSSFSSVGAWLNFTISLDDMTQGLDGETILSRLAEDCLFEGAGDFVRGAKFGLSIKNAAKGIVNFTVISAEGKAIGGVWDIANDTYDILTTTKSVADEKKKKNENTSESSE
jgi:hypothetical protein